MENGSGKLPFLCSFECTGMLAQYSFLLEDNIPHYVNNLLVTYDIYAVCTLLAASCRTRLSKKSKSRLSQGSFLNSQYVT